MSSQLNALNELIREIYPSNSFYAERLEAAGGTNGFESLEDFSRSFPFTTKAELADDFEKYPPYGSKLTYPEERYVRFHQTSGTSGSSMPWLDTAEDWDWILGNWKAVWKGCGAKAGDVALFPFSFGPFLGFWAAFESGSQLGIRCLPSGGQSSADRLRMIQRHKPNWLCCTPTYALRLAEVARQEGVDLATCSVRNIVVAGEPGGSVPEVRARIESAWPGARLHDHHGMTEVGPVTYSDLENRNLLRIVHSSYFAEVIDSKTGEPVELGQTGELVLTTLGRVGSPLLRYRTGDLVRPVAVPGEDERAFALDGGILGRADDMVIIRGVNLYPSAVDAVIRSFNEVGEYQVAVDLRASMAEVSFTVENVSELEDEVLQEKLESKFHEVFSLRIPVKIEQQGVLPVFEMKAKRWKVLR